MMHLHEECIWSGISSYKVSQLIFVKCVLMIEFSYQFVIQVAITPSGLGTFKETGEK